ncbi:ABC transporter C family member 10 [Linum perenne]
MKLAFWVNFCGNYSSSSSFFQALINPYSCTNHVLLICVQILLLLILISLFIAKGLNSADTSPSSRSLSSPDPTLMHISSIFNGVLGFAYLGVGIWIVIAAKFDKDRSFMPLLHEWLVLVLQGFTWLLLNLTVSLKSLVTVYGKAIKIVLFCSFFCSGILCLLSFGEVIRNGSLSFQLILHILSFPGSILFLLCTFKASIVVVISGASTKPLLANEESMEDHHVIRNKSPFARAGTLSRMTFWWLNPLMKKGKEKVLDDNDIPFLRDEDRAESCYLVFMNHRQKSSSSSSSSGFSAMLKAIITWQWEGIWISGLYALIKVLTLSTGPLFLKAFIDVAQGRSSFGYQGYVLTLVLFLSKCLESLSERQWFFRTRLIGIQVRSMLSASIYKKQIRLSNAAKASHSPGEIVNYVTADAYRIGEFPYWFHQIWSTTVQLILAIAIVYSAVGLAGTSAAVISIVLIVIPTYPMVKWQHKYQRMLMAAQDKRLKGISEALANMKVLKLYAWENHFRNVIQSLRNEEFLWISRVLSLKGHQIVLFWSSPIVVPVVTFWVSYLFGIPLSVSNVFTTLSSLRLLQEPIRLIPDVVGVFIEAKVSLDRIVRFLEAPELQNIYVNRHKFSSGDKSVIINASEISWDVEPSSKATLRAIDLEVKKGEKVAICGEVGSGKSTLLAAVLGEVARINGTVEVYGKIAYVSQAAWIQTGTIQENILFGSDMDPTRYNEVLERCSLVKDLEMLPFKDMTQIGERGVNLSGGQKQRVQLARALYQNADVYLLDDPFSAVDAHTATDLFNRYVMEALSGKTVLLVTHQVDFLPAFDSILLMSSGEIVKAASFEKLLESSDEFQKLVDAHKNTDKPDDEPLPKDQLIKKEEKEAGDTGFKPYMQYLSHERGILYYSLAAILHIFFILFGLLQNYYLAAGIQDPRTRKANLLTVYSAIGGIMAVILIIRSRVVVLLGCGTSKSIFSKLLVSLFRAPMSFYDSTPLGRVLSRVSADMSIVDLEMAFKSTITLGSTMSTYSIFAVLAFLSWPRYYVASSKELMRINGTSKSTLASHLAESIAGSVTIRAFGEEERMFAKNLELIDRNASPYFHSFSANKWLVQRLEFLCAIILSSTTLAMAMLDLGASASGFIGMELSYGLSLNMFMLVSVQFQCLLSNLIISVERLEQYTHIASEAPEVIPNNRPQPTWPAIGKLEISNLKVRYRQNAPLVLKGISFTVEGGHKVGIVGRTGSGKTTLISALFRLVDFEQGKIIIDGINISSIGLHDLRSHLAIIPQDPTLFIGTVRYNLDPLSQHTDQEIWKVLEKCHLRDAILEKEERLNAPVAQDGSNWSMGQRQLFCLGRAILKRSRILVLDEATASIDNATDSILQKTIKSEFEDCTVITVAHRIPTVMDCNKVLGISDGKVVEYDEPVELMKRESSLFAQLVKEYWSHSLDSVGPHS